MRRALLAALLALLVLTVPVVAKLPSHPESITPLFSGENVICTTWSVNEKKGLWATAAHCLFSWYEIDGFVTAVPTANLNIKGTPVTGARADMDADLALMEADVHAPGLKFGAYPHMGELMTVYGYPGGLNTPLASWLFVSNPYVTFFDRDWMVLDGSVWPGHSGSPVLDKKGRVVAVVLAHGQGRYSGMTFASTWQQLQAFIADGWQS